jgi:hypothetical protein
MGLVTKLWVILNASDLGLWYPTSREKRARCGAPRVPLDPDHEALDPSAPVGMTKEEWL